MSEHPYVKELLATGRFLAVNSYEPIDQGPKFTAGLLMSVPGCIQPTPLVLVSTEDEIERTGVSELVSVYYLGDRLSGHTGIVHGGLLATLLDEALCRCGFPLLPHHVGVTATISIDYKLPTPTDSYVLLKARTTKAEGRKVWVEGETYVLPQSHDYDPTSELPPTMDARLLVVEPRWYEKLLGGPAARLQETRAAASRQASQEIQK